ncbi:MAG: MBOAT family O-acyltransferase [Woeseiaceae bacterium]
MDAYQGKVPEHGLVEYVVFVTFFPQLIAGPIVHQRDMLPQFRAIGKLRDVAGNLRVGLTIFAIGLFKKVAIADQLAIFANPVFDAALAGSPLSVAEAWTGTLAYTFQLYFDFSGYSDMAIGLGKMFGITLPINFASPYRARNIIDFWRAWHITLSNFLRDYLYFPLGGNRFGSFERYRNLLITMILGGLWHGAGWTFVIWGGLHGLYLTVNHLWRAAPFYKRVATCRAYSGAAWALTLLCVIVGWVFFRAEDFDAALSILQSMSGLNGIDLPQAFEASLRPLLEAASFDGLFPNVAVNIPLGWLSAFPLILVSGLVALFGPNVFEMFHDQLTAEMNSRVPYRPTSILWKPNTIWAVLAGLMLAYCLLSLSSPSEFLYFQF